MAPETQKEPQVRPNFLFFTRREFVGGLVAGLVIGGGAVATLVPRKGDGGSGVTTTAEPGAERPYDFEGAVARPVAQKVYIIPDFQKCINCRICEIECARKHEKGIDMYNPARARIKIDYYNLNGPIEVQRLCYKCGDQPCIASCPVEGCMTKDETTGTVRVNLEKCVGCMRCVDACREKGSGVIRPTVDNQKVEGICDLCNGDPGCVKACPENALALMPVYADGRYYAAPTEEIAKLLSDSFYPGAKQL